MTILIDTNILLDVVQKRPPHHISADRVWQFGESGAVDAHVSAISFNNVFYVLRKQIGSSDALEAVKLVRSSFRVVPLDEAILDRAIAMAASDFEDAIQAAAAARVRAHYIVSRNLADFGKLGVPALSADGFLALMGSP